jgi:hypothetical protein
VSKKADDQTPPRLNIRIESLSDLIFGLALSIGSITLILKITDIETQIEYNILVFGFGFFIIIATWLGYTRIAAVLALDRSYALALNILLLFTVSLEPYLLYLLYYVDTTSGYFVNFSSTLYAIDVGVMFVTLATLARLVVRGEREHMRLDKVHPVTIKRFRNVMIAEYIVGGLFLLSALPIFWVPYQLRFYFFFSSVILFIAPRIGSRTKSRSQELEQSEKNQKTSS